MDTVKESAINNARAEIQRLEDRIKAMESIPDGLPFEGMCASEYTIIAYMPWDRERCTHAENMLIYDGWEFINDYDQDNGDRVIGYRKENEILKIFLDPTLRGSTCERVQVGTREIPLYEVRCAS